MIDSLACARGFDGGCIVPDVPLAYHITWTTYGTWLPGDERGWVDANQPGLQPPDEERLLLADRNLAFDPVVLTPPQREVVGAALVDHCKFRNWTLHVQNVRTQSRPRRGDFRFAARRHARSTESVGLAANERFVRETKSLVDAIWIDQMDLGRPASDERDQLRPRRSMIRRSPERKPGNTAKSDFSKAGASGRELFPMPLGHGRSVILSHPRLRWGL
jgi:hypothetical protein